MKTKRFKLIPLIIATLFAVPHTHAQSTALTYQGALSDENGPATGLFDITFGLFTTDTGGTAVSTETNTGVSVVDGLFTTTLNYGAAVFDGTDYWLEIGVQPDGGGGFTTLSPRQRLAAVPYAIRANMATMLEGALPSGQLSGTYPDPLTLNNRANVFVGEGSGLTLLDASQLTAGAVPTGVLGNAWKTSGNTGTTPGVNSLGTKDDQPLDFIVNEQRALRLEPATHASSGVSPNIIGGEVGNQIASGTAGAVIAGGGGAHSIGGAHTIGTNSHFAAIGGGMGNRMLAGSSSATIGGGERNTIEAQLATIGGGSANNVLSPFGTIAGGSGNQIGGGAFWGTIGGGGTNNVLSNHGTIAGGWRNQIGGGAFGGTIGGGRGNNILSLSSTIAGGWFNQIGEGADGGTIGGGENNEVQNDYGTIAGGRDNLCNLYSAVGGGQNNSATSSYGTVPGGQGNEATSTYTFAAGRRAKAHHSGAFVWADSTSGDFASTSNDQFSIRATGGVRLSSGTPQLSFGATSRQMIDLWRTNYAIGVQSGTAYFRSNSRFSWFQGGSHSSGENDPGAGGAVLMTLSSGGLTVNGTLVSSSDRNLKENFAPVNATAVLEKVVRLPLRQWNYRADEERSRHLGPMAQDFRAAFGLGADEKHIATVDADGVALAAIQGLNQKLVEKDAEIESLKQRMAVLEKWVQRSLRE